MSFPSLLPPPRPRDLLPHFPPFPLLHSRAYDSGYATDAEEDIATEEGIDESQRCASAQSVSFKD